MAQAWTYKVVLDETLIDAQSASAIQVSLGETLSKLGLEGWELVTVRPEPPGVPFQGGFWVFKKAVP